MKLIFHIQKAYLSHCPNRWPDFQQQIQLDQIPESTAGGKTEKEVQQLSALFQVHMTENSAIRNMNNTNHRRLCVEVLLCTCHK